LPRTNSTKTGCGAAGFFAPIRRDHSSRPTYREFEGGLRLKVAIRQATIIVRCSAKR
jgi:hypothetical protein